LDDRWLASPLGRSRLIAAGIMVFCLIAMFLIVRLGPGSELAGIL